MKLKDIRRHMEELGYEEIKIVNSSHRVYRDTRTGKTLLIGPDFFRGHRRGIRWLRSFRRKIGEIK